MERKIGETFEYEGKILQVKASVRKYSCIGCIFGRKCSSRTKLVSGICGNGRREDGNDVIFVEVAKEQSQDEQPQKLNLCEILKNCPEGKPFWSPLLDDVRLYNIDEEEKKIVVIAENGVTWEINADATITINGVKSPEIMLYPSREQRDWTKVKYEPKKERFDPKTFIAFDKILVRKNNDYDWSCDFFSHLKNQKCYTITYSTFSQTIPYNDETKHLVGTTDQAPEFYKYWED